MEEVLRELKKINKRLDSMDARFDKIDKRLGAMDARLDSMDERFDKIDKRLDEMDEHFNSMDRRFENLEEANMTTRDIIKDMELRLEDRFSRLEGRLDNLSAGQKEIRADIASLRRDIFLESGAREHADNAIFSEQSENYKDLDRRLRLVEAKFPDLTQSAAA